MDTEQLQGDRPSQVHDSDRRNKIQIHRMLIKAGKIDIGPKPDQSDTVEDIRDMRDPIELGSAVRSVAAHTGMNFVHAADEIDHDLHGHIRDYRADFIDHAELRAKELQARADAGDKFAAALLRGDSLAEDPVD